MYRLSDSFPVRPAFAGFGRAAFRDGMSGRARSFSVSEYVVASSCRSGDLIPCRGTRDGMDFPAIGGRMVRFFPSLSAVFFPGPHAGRSAFDGESSGLAPVAFA